MVQSSAQHQELMKKVQTLNVVTDSNRLMREEKERLEQQLQQLKAKVKDGAIQWIYPLLDWYVGGQMMLYCYECVEVVKFLVPGISEDVSSHL